MGGAWRAPGGGAVSRRPVLDGRTDRVDVRCLPLQRARWEVAARRAHRTLADWIRLALDDAEREQRPGRRPATADGEETS